jgi:succinate dehydrogenase / fumarate reductase cytochrome b subunit
MSSTKYQRPLSPFWLYRWQYTMTLSILHRFTGCALSVGLLLFIYWLTAVARGAQAYEQALEVFAHPLTRIALFAFSFAFFYHLVNGVRHLVWDTGRGLERNVARVSGWVAFIGAVALTVMFWLVVGKPVGGGVG